MERVASGRWFEELPVGLVITHAVTRTVTEADNTLFSTLTMNPQPLHLDAAFAAETEFGERLVNSLFTLGLLVGITVYETTLGTTVANLGFEEVAFPAPVKAEIKRADRISAWLEAVRIAGFAEAEANRLFGTPRLAGVGSMQLRLRPPAEAREAFLERHAELQALLEGRQAGSRSSA